MATTRFSHLDDFTLKNSKVGIGTSDPTEALEVIGGARGGSVDVTGIATFTSYEGFQNSKFTTTGDVLIGGGESGTLSGEVVIGAGLTMSVGTGATSGQGSIKSLKVSNTFTPPIGGTSDRPSAPQPGALYYNKDFRTIEYWDGSFWRQVDNTTKSGRAVFTGGHTGSWQTHCTDIDTILISTLGNAVNWGELANTCAEQAGCSDGTRGVVAGGYVHPGTTVNIMEYTTIASSSVSIDFGDYTTAANNMGKGGNSSTRGMFGNIGPTKQVDYVEIQTIGNAIDFGDLVTTDKDKGAAVSSPIRVIFGPGAPQTATKMEGCITASKGSKFNWGEGLRRRAGAACSNNVRGLFAGGYGSPGNQKFRDITMVNLASTGNTQEFGELINNQHSYMTGCSNHVRGIWAGGYSPTRDPITYSNIASAGKSVDFGNLSRAKAAMGAFTDSNGGLGGF